jgi:hypothetical protein
MRVVIDASGEEILENVTFNAWVNFAAQSRIQSGVSSINNAPAANER